MVNRLIYIYIVKTNMTIQLTFLSYEKKEEAEMQEEEMLCMEGWKMYLP